MVFSILLIYLSPNHTQFYFMKKLFLSLLAAASVLTASAQPQSILLYGNLNVSSVTDQDQTKSSSWNITPGVGYQFDNHWTGGINLSFGGVKVTPQGQPAAVDETMFSGGLFGRYTHTMGSMFYCFGQLDASFMSNKDNTPGGYTTSGPVINLWPAVGMNVGKGYAINFAIGGLGYSSMKSSAPGAVASNVFTFNFGQAVMIGMSKNFACKMHNNHKSGDDKDMNNSSNDDDNNMPKKHKKHHKKADSDNDDNNQ
jgi:hypothetical protein